MSLATIAAALADGPFLDKFRASALGAAGYILIEDPGTANHPARLRWAKRVLSATGAQTLAESAGRMLRYALATHVDVMTEGTAATDAHIDSAVATVLGDPAVLEWVLTTDGASF